MFGKLNTPNTHQKPEKQKKGASNLLHKRFHINGIISDSNKREEAVEDHHHPCLEERKREKCFLL